jgi:pimeloyl-ACP methyl ester carboxylesterase
MVSAWRRVALALFLLLAAWPLRAEEIKTRYHGITINANLELAPGKGLEDGVILIAHGQLAHNRMELISALQRGLKKQGYSTLAINLSLGVDDRHGMFDCGRLHAHRPADALDEIDAWIGWLKNQGATEITLLGHSQGGAQVALYAAERRDPSVGGVVLLAPATFDPERVAAAYEQRFDTPLAPILARAEELLRSGRGETRIDQIGFLYCQNATATAASIVGWYAPSPLRNTPTLLPRIRQRTLVVAAGADSVVPDLTDQLRTLEGQRNLAVEVIDGADHFFLDLYADEAVETIAGWLQR